MGGSGISKLTHFLVAITTLRTGFTKGFERYQEECRCALTYVVAGLALTYDPFAFFSECTFISVVVAHVKTNFFMAYYRMWVFTLCTIEALGRIIIALCHYQIVSDGAGYVL
jgi:hypothetical protein